jgi:hypothetical protein
MRMSVFLLSAFVITFAWADVSSVFRRCSAYNFVSCNLCLRLVGCFLLGCGAEEEDVTGLELLVILPLLPCTMVGLLGFPLLLWMG